MPTRTAAELAKSLSDVLSRTRYRGERFVVLRNGEPIAGIGPPGVPSGITARELVEKLGELVLPGDGFADDLVLIQAKKPMAEDLAWPI